MHFALTLHRLHSNDPEVQITLRVAVQPSVPCPDSLLACCKKMQFSSNVLWILQACNTTTFENCELEFEYCTELEQFHEEVVDYFNLTTFF